MHPITKETKPNSLQILKGFSKAFWRKIRVLRISTTKYRVMLTSLRMSLTKCFSLPWVRTDKRTKAKGLESSTSSSAVIRTMKTVLTSTVIWTMGTAGFLISPKMTPIRLMTSGGSYRTCWERRIDWRPRWLTRVWLYRNYRKRVSYKMIRFRGWTKRFWIWSRPTDTWKNWLGKGWPKVKSCHSPLRSTTTVLKSTKESLTKWSIWRTYWRRKRSK